LLAVGKEASCDAAANDPDDKEVAVFNSLPNYDSPLSQHYGDIIRNLENFMLAGATGKICGLEQMFWFAQDPNVKDRYGEWSSAIDGVQ
jgi:hypothetical protein